MPTRTYKSYSDYDSAQRHFAFNTVGDNTYLVIGDLSQANREYLPTVLTTQYVGFFQNDVEIAYRQIEAIWDTTNGFQVGPLEKGTLVEDQEYELRFQQPDTTGDAADGADAKVQYRACPTRLTRTFEQVDIFAQGVMAGEVFVTHDLVATDENDAFILFATDDTEADLLTTLESPDLIRLIHNDVDVILQVSYMHDTRPAGNVRYQCSVPQGEGMVAARVFDDDDVIEIRIYKGAWRNDKSEGDQVIRIGTGDPVVWENLIDMCVVDGRAGRDGTDGVGTPGAPGEDAEIEIQDTPSDDENAPGIRVRGKSGGETEFGNWYYVQDGEDGEDADLNNLVVKTRGELIATSSYFPQDNTGITQSLHNDITWAINSTAHGRLLALSEAESNIDVTKFDAFSDGNEQGILHIPSKPVADNVNGFWLVCEDVADETQTEQYVNFVPWGPSGIEVLNNNLTSRHVLHFGIASGEGPTDGDDVVALYYKERDSNHKDQLNILIYGGTLPSAQCRVKVYLAGVFLSVESE